MKKLFLNDRIYTGIGSRETPSDIQRKLTDTAKKLNSVGFTLRSGHADGADKAFEKGSNRKEVYVPWSTFNGFSGDFVDFDNDLKKFTAKEFDKYRKGEAEWTRIKEPVQKIMMRNVKQIIGEDINNPIPSDFVVCWAETDEEGNPVGGTGFAVHIAKKFDIPILNINNPDDLKTLHILLTCLKYDHMIKFIRQLLTFYYDELDSESQEILDSIESIPYVSNLENKDILSLHQYLTKEFTILLKHLYNKHRKLRNGT